MEKVIFRHNYPEIKNMINRLKFHRKKTEIENIHPPQTAKDKSEKLNFVHLCSLIRINQINNLTANIFSFNKRKNTGGEKKIQQPLKVSQAEKCVTLKGSLLLLSRNPPCLVNVVNLLLSHQMLLRG